MIIPSALDKQRESVAYIMGSIHSFRAKDALRIVEECEQRCIDIIYMEAVHIDAKGGVWPSREHYLKLSGEMSDNHRETRECLEQCLDSDLWFSIVTSENLTAIEKDFQSVAMIRGYMFLLRPKDALQFTDECERREINLLGADGFRIYSNGGIQPLQERSFDFEDDLANCHERTRDFIRDWLEDDIWLELSTAD